MLPAMPAVFDTDYETDEFAEIARKLRQAAGLPKEPTGAVANGKRSRAGAKAKSK